ncbi:MAG: M42 family metallopeptidase [Bacteroidota bacterium]
MNAVTKQLLDEILTTHSPCGQEQEVETICLRLFGEYCDEVYQDANENVVGKIAGESSADATLLLAHKDEISTMVRKIDEDGKIWLEPLGGTVPWKYGEGPYDVLGDHETVTGVLSVGSTHVSHLSPRIQKAKSDSPLNWEMCYLDCKLNKEQLVEKGVRIGSLACVSRQRKQPLYLQDKFVGGYALDDKASLVSLFLAMKEIQESGRRPAQDVYFGATSVEELGISGASYVTRTLTQKHNISTVIAVEVAPVADEYSVAMDERPVILMKDAIFMYHPALCRELMQTADRLGLGHQQIVVRCFGSDTSSVVKYGFIGRAGCVAFPTENTHGYEVAPVAAIENVGRLLAGYVLG